MDTEHPNLACIRAFYAAFAARDAAAMAACYAPDVAFSDPVFPSLRGSEVGAMWAMLCDAGEDLRVELVSASADDATGEARWDARYTFAGGRPVHNVIRARFTFQSGLIASHVDTFDFWRWSRQAIGPAGLALGWTPWLRRQVQRRAAKQLARKVARG